MTQETSREIRSEITIWRRSYDTPPPDGESLKNTAERVLPYFNELVGRWRAKRTR